MNLYTTVGIQWWRLLCLGDEVAGEEEDVGVGGNAAVAPRLPDANLEGLPKGSGEAGVDTDARAVGG